MGSTLALIAFIVGIGGLFYLDRDNSARTSKALWLPVIWIWINGSRPISAWLGMSQLTESSSGLPDSSLVDQLVAGTLMLLGVMVLIRRQKDLILLLRRSWPITFYFAFCFVSVFWSDFPTWGFKRWIRALGDLAMVMVLATDAEQAAALKRFLSRVGFVLLPASVLLLKYYPDLSHSYDEWGFRMNTGVTTNKNILGVITLVLALGTVWQVLTLLRDKQKPNRARHLVAQCVLLYFGISLLFTAHSATSGACFILGLGLMLTTSLPQIRNRPAAVHVLILVILLGGALTILLGGKGAAVKAMGRNEDFTGRTEVWQVVIPMAPNPVIGAGFETFWLGPRAENVRRVFSSFINEAHNGYIEVYLNLGLVGVGLIALILTQGYRSAVAAFRRNWTFGSLLVAYILAGAIYSVTEAGFRMLGPMWFFLLLAVVASSRLKATAMDCNSNAQDSLPTFQGKQLRSSRSRSDEQMKCFAAKR
jgi:exopolysaccharide production protein ExoQ